LTATPGLARRPATDADRAFLFEVYASTRAEELKLVPWTDAQKEAFVRQQFEAQDAYYREHYQDTTWEVVLADGVPAGRIYVARWPQEIRVIDIALLPAHRRLGLGTRLLTEVLEEARAARRPVRIHVEVMNPARALYERLGFRQVADQGVYVMMEWNAVPAGGAP
jgi:ribosomal protein S18 acetylase RimI-like enzyme